MGKESKQWILVNISQLDKEKIELLFDNEYTRCSICQKVVHTGNYCEMCGFKLPK